MNAQAPLMAEITVQKVWNNAKGPCKLIDATGKEWKFWKPGKFPGIDPETFVEGQSYKISYEVKPYDGKDEFYIKHVDTGQSRPVPKALHKPPAAQEPRPPTNPVDSERMWSCAVFVAAVEGGHVDVKSVLDMMETFKCIRAVYANTYGNPKKAATEAELNDEVAF